MRGQLGSASSPAYSNQGGARLLSPSRTRALFLCSPFQILHANLVSDAIMHDCSVKSARTHTPEHHTTIRMYTTGVRGPRSSTPHPMAQDPALHSPAWCRMQQALQRVPTAQTGACNLQTMPHRASRMRYLECNYIKQAILH